MNGYGEPKTFDELPLDDVIMAPEMLLRFTGIEEQCLRKLLESERNTMDYCLETMRQALLQMNCASDEPSEVKTHILEVIDRALPLAGYKVIDGDRDSIMIRHSDSDADFEIKVVPMA